MKTFTQKSDSAKEMEQRFPDADFITAAKLSGYQAEPFTFLCPRCKTHPGWFQRGRLIAVGCPCGSVMVEAHMRQFLPRIDFEWTQWLSEIDAAKKRGI